MPCRVLLWASAINCQPKTVPSAADKPRIVELRVVSDTGWPTEGSSLRLGASRRAPRAQRVARQLLELSRLENGVEVAEQNRIDLIALVRAVLGDYPTVETVEGVAPLWIQTDSRRLATVLFAVLDNAIVHGAPPVRVLIGPRAIVITDHGPGLSASLLTEATRPFRTGSRVNARGAGLGLAIAAAQMRLLSGRLELDNDPNAGARVTVHLDTHSPAPGGQLVEFRR